MSRLRAGETYWHKPAGKPQTDWRKHPEEKAARLRFKEVLRTWQPTRLHHTHFQIMMTVLPAVPPSLLREEAIPQDGVKGGWRLLETGSGTVVVRLFKDPKNGGYYARPVKILVTDAE